LIFFIIWSGEKRVLMHLHILPDHKKKPILKMRFDACAHSSRPLETCFKKTIFYRLERLLMRFDAFAHTTRPLETFF
jgi:hypothetical protein